MLVEKYKKNIPFWNIGFALFFIGSKEIIIKKAFVYKIAEVSKVKPIKHKLINSLRLSIIMMLLL